MTVIEDIITKIRTAVYGKDVRTGIADGIETINSAQEDLESIFTQLVINAGNSNAEIVVARDEYDTLGDRLNDQKINLINNTTDVQALKGQITGAVSGAPKAVSLASQMTDTTKNYVYTGVEAGYTAGNWYYYDSSWVSGGAYQETALPWKYNQLLQLPLFEAGINKFSKLLVNDGILLGLNNKQSTNSAYSTSVYPVSISPSTQYTGENFGDTAFVTFYDKDMNYTHTGLLNLTYDSITYGNTIATNANDYFCRFSLLTTSKAKAFFRLSSLGVSGSIAYRNFNWILYGNSLLKNFKRGTIASGKMTIIKNSDDYTVTIENGIDGSFMVVTEKGYTNASNNTSFSVNNLDFILYDTINKKLVSCDALNLELLDFSNYYLICTIWDSVNGMQLLLADAETLQHTIMTRHTTNLQGGDIIKVGKYADCHFSSVQRACDFAKDGDTIFIYPGTYNECVDIKTRELHLVGLDRETTIIQSTNDSREYPPLEMCKGTAKNITFYAKRPEGSSHPTYETPYGAHIDYDDEANSILIFDNCTFKSDWNAGAGVGMRAGFDLKFRNCKFETLVTGMGALFFHDSSNSDLAGTYKISVENCDIYSHGNRAISILGIGYTDNNMLLSMYKNRIWCDTNKATLDAIQVQTPSAPYPTSIGNKFMDTATITLTEDSFGNNMSVFNA